MHDLSTGTLATDPDQAAKLVAGQYDAPAYARRGQQMQNALDALLAQCRRQREEWLDMVRLRLGVLQALAGAWSALRPFLADDAQVRILEQLAAELKPSLRLPVEATTSARRLGHALDELRGSLNRFNRRWPAYLATVDLTRVNQLIDGYNRYYVLEKECVVRSAPLARHGFTPHELLSVAGLTALMPQLPVPALKG
jgi:hypothetical protein